MNAPFVMGSVLACGAGLVSAACLWPSRGWHPATGPALAPAADSLPAGLVAVTVPTAVDENPETELTLDADLTTLFAAGEIDATDFDLCPREQRIRPHAIRADGSRRCWECGHETAGDQ
ncbi:hypothetical protein [Streptomyces halobius]|uniref:Uncharacterized protein n=1 Tax=Streptomyces halobius TaxID=2879846 RepID=A0ABY4MH39_9ACTN|nr:hypothetical protein [Streptomyces halobius]UQA95725.1 hypothetical protein K9S39_31115 [Streptomyces halobius]